MNLQDWLISIGTIALGVFLGSLLFSFFEWTICGTH